MKRLLILMLMAAFVLAMVGCKGTPPPPPPEEPKVEEPKEPVEPPKEEVKEVVPEVIPVKESDFMTVYFDFDKYNLVDSAKRALENNAQVLKDNPNVMILVEGHCDERGTVEYNLALGEKRALSSLEYLKNLGIKDSRIETISYGEERPAVMGSNEAAWAKNRRCMFKITSQ